MSVAQPHPPLARAHSGNPAAARALLLWSLECVALSFAYEGWVAADIVRRARAYEGYVRALNHEQRAADHYARTVTRRRRRKPSAAALSQT